MTAQKHDAFPRWSVRAEALESFYLDSKQCQHQVLPEKAGVGYTDFYLLDKDLSCMETRYLPERNLAVLTSTPYQEPRLVVTLTLKGNSSYKNHAGQEVLFKEGYTTITTFNSSIGARLYEAGKEIIQLRLSLSQNWANQYLDENASAQLFGKSGLQQISLHPATLQGIRAAKDLMECNLGENLKRMYMQGQAMTLLACELKHLFNAGSSDLASFEQKDREIAFTARDILLREFRSPPSVKELSKRAGTNQFKLKQLFHHYFDNTPYGLLFEIRMNRAYQVLETNRCHVNVAADFVGYHHASNFSAAFIKHFGVSPKVVASGKKSSCNQIKS